MKVYEMVERWGVLIADNATNNDTCCEALVKQLLPDEDCKTARRARCFGHMVNIAAKAFIYGVQSERFLAEADQIVTLSNRDQTAVAREMAFWRQKESFGKFHNVVKHIRASHIREEQFQRFIGVAMASGGGGGGGGGVDSKSNYRIHLCARYSYLIER